MQFNSSHKASILVMLMLALTTISQQAFSLAADDLYVDVYTVTDNFETTQVYDSNTGKFEQVPDSTKPIIKHEYGTLFFKDGFIPSSSATATLSSYGLDLETANAINGKTVVKLSYWISINNLGEGKYLSNFPRSSQTYALKGVPYVIVSVKGASNNTGGETNTTTTSCTSIVTSITAGLPAVTVSATQPNAAEAGLINGRFQINLDAPRANKTIVSFTISGSALKGKDYKSVKNTVVIPAGTTSAFVDIQPINDKKQEVTENIILDLATASGYTLGTAPSATVEIIDND